DTIQLETAVSTISQEYLLEFTSEYGISEDVHPEFPGPEDRIVDFSEGKVGVYTKFFEFANFRIPLSQFLLDILGHYQIHLSQLSVIGAAKIFLVDERVFLTAVDRRTHAPKDEMPAANTYSRSDVAVLSTRRTPIQKQPEILLCLVGLSRRYYLGDDVYPTFLHDDDRGVALTATESRVIDMEDPDAATESSGTPSAVENSLLDFDNENPASPMTEEVREYEVAALEPRVSKKRGRRGNDEADANAQPKVLRKDYATAATPEAKHDPILRDFYRKCGYHESARHAFCGKYRVREIDLLLIGSPGENYQPGWGVTNSCRLDTPDACQDVVDHIVPPGYFSELRHMPNVEFLSQYNKNLVQQVAMGSQLRLRFEQEVRLLKKARAQIARRDQRIQVREEKIKKLDQEIQGLQNQTGDLKTLLEAETDMKKAAETKNADLTKELKSLREEKIKSAFEEFKKYEDDRVEKRCAEIDVCLDALSIDFDEELYPHMLTAIAGRRWVIGHGLRLAMMKCGESTKLRQVFADVVFAGIAKGMSEELKYGVEHGKANIDLEAIEAYDPEAETKYVRDPKDPWAFKEEILLADAIAANVSRVEKKKKCRVVCRTHGIGSAHHARSDGVPVLVPTIAPQGLAILLADAATQTETSEDGASPRLLSVIGWCVPDTPSHGADPSTHVIIRVIHALHVLQFSSSLIFQVPQGYDASSAMPCLFIHSVYVIHCLYIRSLSVMLSRISFHVLYGRGYYALSWKPCQGDSLNLPDHSLVPAKSNSYYQAFNVKSLFGEIDCPKKSQVKLNLKGQI
nr:transposase (putative), gypsy type [Tanacetum cinerariifolium]